MKNLVCELTGCEVDHERDVGCDCGECKRCLKQRGNPKKVVLRRRRAWLRYYSQTYFRWPDCGSRLGA